MPTTKPKITIYLTQEVYDYLKQWAQSEHRSVSNLVLKHIDIAIAQHKSKIANLTNFQPLTVNQLVKANLTKLRQSQLDNLDAIANNQVLPTPDDFRKIAEALELPVELSEQIWLSTFYPFVQPQ